MRKRSELLLVLFHGGFMVLMVMCGFRPKPVFTDDFIRQLVAHVHVYAELLFRWQMYEKRIQLLKTVNKRNHVKEEHKGAHYQVGELLLAVVT